MQQKADDAPRPGTRPLRGLEAFQDSLDAVARGGRRHHALLLTGMRGSGKRTLAKALARGRLCRADEATRGAFGCSSCGACGRVARGQHPDVSVVEREAGKTRVSVEALRQLVDDLRLGSLEGGGRVAILADADRLAREGQNALLKTLEEPAPATTLILTAERPEGLLDTVRSRCERIAVPALSTAEVARFLRELLFDGADVRGDAQVDHERIARLARGSLGQAIELAGGKLALFEPFCRPIFERSSYASLAPASFAARALEGVDAGEDGLRQGKQQRAEAVLRLALALASERYEASAAGTSHDAGPDPWRVTELCFDALLDLDQGLGADITLAGFYAALASDA